MRKMELLAPAGTERALMAAVQSGADAVYLGTDMFSARQAAGNFPISELKKWVEYCHLYGVKVHAAVNTLIKEKELEQAAEYAVQLSDSGVDAVIIQDMGLAEVFRSCAPQLPLHASTQMTVTTLDGVRFLEERGFERVVLARELTRDEVRAICAGAKAEIEVFVHGALCMCYSGQCLMSSVIGGRSGNRGRCAQPCRLPYEIDGQRRYYLSPQDLCLLDELEELSEMGVSSLKIEGRLKRPEYVSAVVGVYRSYIDSPRPVEEKDRQELLDAFSRSGFTKGFFGGEQKTMMSFDDPANTSGNKFTDAAKKRAAENADIRKVPVLIKGTLKIGEPLVIEMSDHDGHTATAKSEIVAEKAQNRPLDKQRLSDQLQKLGATAFKAESTLAEVDGKSTLPIKCINSTRRQCCESLAAERMKREKRTTVPYIKRDTKTRAIPKLRITADVMTAEQARVALKAGIDTVYIPLALEKEFAGEKRMVVKLPPIDNIKGDTKAERVMVSSNAQIYRYSGRQLYGGERLNVFNSETVRFYEGLRRITVSPELNAFEIGASLKGSDAEVEAVGYGRLPLMICRNCPLKQVGRCKKGKGAMLCDRRREVFPLICGEECTAMILNSKPLFLADRLDDIIPAKINFLKLIFTVENSDECGKIIDIYRSAVNGERVENPFAENTFTRGHWFRGVQ